MNLKKLLKNDIPTINQNTTGNMALLIMEEYKTSHLIVLSEVEFKGILNQDAILEMEDLTKSIKSILNQAKNISLNTNNHICIALKTFSEHKVSIIPVFEFLFCASSGLSTTFPSMLITSSKLNFLALIYELLSISELNTN